VPFIDGNHAADQLERQTEMNEVTQRSTAATYMSRVARLVPSARTVKVLQSRPSKRHTLQDARQAVAEKLRQNAAYLRDPASVEQPDAVYRMQSDGTYAVGVKYGNRWLVGVFDGGTYVLNVAAENVGELLEMLATDALDGMFDEYIKPIMAANLQAKAKAA
jgi:hypothetical protein